MTDALPRDCPPAEMLGAFLEGKLNETERAEIARHLEGCPECMFVLGEAGRFEREESVSSGAELVPFRRASRWWLAAAAAVLTIAIGAGVWSFSRTRPGSSSYAQMIALALKTPRDIEARIAGVGWTALRPVTRSGAETLDPGQLRLAGAAGAVLEETASRSDAASLHAAGVAHLLIGRPVEAVDRLRTLAMQNVRNADVWSDLAAAYYTSAVKRNRPADLPLGLAAADRALAINPKHPAALFNRALILEGIGYLPEARRAWQRYLDTDLTSNWRGEAEEHLRKLSQSPIVSFRTGVM